MIFAKVDVGLPQHHRVLAIPRKHRAAAIGVWTTALCYSRGNELDGFCPDEAIDMIASKEVIDQLVGVGLLARDEKDGVHGVVVLRYADHNETKAQIDDRRAVDRSRKPKKSKNDAQADSDRIPIGIREDPSGIPSGIRSESERSPKYFPDSDSDSVSDSVSDLCEGELERGGPAVSGVLPADEAPSETVSVPPPVRSLSPRGDAERYVQIGDSLTIELRAIAEGATGARPVRDVGGAWLKFCGHYAGKWVHVAGKWQHWCVNESKRETADAYAKAPAGTPIDPDSPAVIAARRKREAGYREAERNAVPAHIGAKGLLDALKPKRETGS